MTKATVYLTRVFLFIGKYAVIILLVSAMLIFSFFTAMNIANNYIIIKDGLSLRAAVAIDGEDSTELSRYFSSEFLENDEVLNSSDYADFVIRTYDQETKIERIWSWPWSNEATATIVDFVGDIEGTLPTGSDGSDTNNKEAVKPPEWKNARYDVKLKKVEDSEGNKFWRIESMKLVEEVNSIREARPTPWPTPTLTPEGTQTPATDSGAATNASPAQ